MTDGFPAQGVSNVDRWRLLCFPEQAVEPTAELSVTWNAMAPIWRHTIFLNTSMYLNQSCDEGPIIYDGLTVSLLQRYKRIAWLKNIHWKPTIVKLPTLSSPIVAIVYHMTTKNVFK